MNKSFRRAAMSCAAVAFGACAAVAGAADTRQGLHDGAGSAVGLSVQPSAVAQIALLQQMKRDKSPVQDKIGSRLYMALMHQRHDARLLQLPQLRFLTTGKDGRTPVDITFVDGQDPAAVLRKLHDLDAELVSPKRTAYEDRTLRARVHLDDLETLAALKPVSKIREAVDAVTNGINVSEGDRTHGADTARATYGAMGAGVKVCVISDGVDHLAQSQASGDLPPGIDVLPGQAGEGDEGTAMLEIVHDLAPAATLGFATAIRSEASFARNIRNLAASGCSIIVDDIFYFDEAPFQDGPVARAVNDVIDGGALYFSAVGNSNNRADRNSGTWEGDFRASTLANPGSLAGIGPLHDFGDGGQSIEITNIGNRAILGWAESYDLAGGIASTDYDLYQMDADLSNVIDASMDRQDGVGGDDVPFEAVFFASTGQRLVVNRFAVGTTSSAPMFSLNYYNGSLNQRLATTGATRGHNSAAGAFSIAATPAAEANDGVAPAGPYPDVFTSANVSEPYSSDGPRRIILRPNGSEFTPGNRTSTGGVLRRKPDLTAADGVSTAAPGFSSFYGTSAAAPHAAAIAALLKSAVPSLPQKQVRNILTSTAIDIEKPGVDATTGAGIVVPGPALAAAGATPQPYLSAGSAVFTQVTGDGDAFIEPNETWALQIPLNNIGASPARALNGTLTSPTTGITITQATSAYPEIARGASASNTTAFEFRVGSAVSCGGAIAFSLDAAYTGVASPQTFAVSNTTGGTGATRSFRYTGPAVAIPDAGAAIDVPVTVSGVDGNIGRVSLSIDGSLCSASAGSTTVGISHSAVEDLQISLVSPAGRVVRVIDSAGGSGHNFCKTALDDASTGSSIQTVSPSQNPFRGSFKPANPLAALNGSAANGVWRLRAQDISAADTGSVRAFTVAVAPVVCDVPADGPTLSVGNASAPEGGPLGQSSLSFDVTLSAPATSTITVAYATTDNTATIANRDYTAASGTLSFNAGETTKAVRVTIRGDRVREPDESLFLNLSNASGAAISHGQGIGTIQNDD